MGWKEKCQCDLVRIKTLKQNIDLLVSVSNDLWTGVVSLMATIIVLKSFLHLRMHC